MWPVQHRPHWPKHKQPPTQLSTLATWAVVDWRYSPGITWVRNTPAQCLLTREAVNQRECFFPAQPDQLVYWMCRLFVHFCFKFDENLKRRIWRASYLKGATWTVVNGQDVCDVVSCQLLPVSGICHKQKHQSSSMVLRRHVLKAK